MPSKNASIWAAVKNFLEAYPNLPAVYYGGQSFDPPLDGALVEPYIIVDDVRFDGQRKYHGSGDANWHSGELSINTMTPLSWGDLQHAEFIGDIADYFAQDSKMTYGDVTVKVSRNPTVSGAGYRNVDMWRQVVMVPWEGFV